MSSFVNIVTLNLEQIAIVRFNRNVSSIKRLDNGGGYEIIFADGTSEEIEVDTEMVSYISPLVSVKESVASEMVVPLSDRYYLNLLSTNTKSATRALIDYVCLAAHIDTIYACNLVIVRKKNNSVRKSIAEFTSRNIGTRNHLCNHTQKRIINMFNLKIKYDEELAKRYY